MAITETTSSSVPSGLHEDERPYVMFHTTTREGRLYQVNGKGFSTPHPGEATRHPVVPEETSFRLEGGGGRTPNIHCHAPLYIRSILPGQVEAYWGSHRLLLSPDDLIRQAGGFVWSKLKHCHRGGSPFGPIVRIVTDGPKEGIAIFNIEIHAPPGQSGFLHPAPDGWDSWNRSIMTRLGMLGFSNAGPQPDQSRGTVWRRPLQGRSGTIVLVTGVGSLIQSLTVIIPGQEPYHVGTIGSMGPHNLMHGKIISLIVALESPGCPADLTSVVLSIFP